MSSKKEEDRNEKIIRGLMKLPPNRRCINCDSLGPQYVCTNFWTFVCITCSGIHREFTHRVKSVSMAKFTTQEVEALQRGGNQRAREMFLKDWDAQRMRLPDSSNVDKIREFIKCVYVDKKYAKGKSDKPPMDMQSLKKHEEYRRASSYHSFSQSPPYEHQYEDRHSGKQTGMLSRKPGSDRALYEGKVSSFIYSPGHPGEQMYEDRFANESVGSRLSDYSVSSTVDPFRSDGQSPNFQDTGYTSPRLQQVRDILIEDANVKRGFDGIPRPQRTASSGSFGSFDGNSAANLGSVMDIVLEPEHTFGTQQAETSFSPPIDLFAGINHQASSTISSEQSSLADQVSENVGWATFDLPHHPGPSSETNKVLPLMASPSEEVPKGSATAISSMRDNLQWFPVQNSASHVPFSSIADQWHVGLGEVKGSPGPKNSQSWNAFDDEAGDVSQHALSTLPPNSETQVMVHRPLTSGDSSISFEISEASVKNGFHRSAVDDNALGLSLPSDGVAGSSSPPSVSPLMGGTTQERKSTNPFDLPYDSDAEANNVFQFLDTSSLQAALPNPQLLPPFLGGLSQPWLTQSFVTTYVPSVPEGELASINGIVLSSQLPNTASPDPAASLGGNPFA